MLLSRLNERTRLTPSLVADYLASALSWFNWWCTLLLLMVKTLDLWLLRAFIACALLRGAAIFFYIYGVLLGQLGSLNPLPAQEIDHWWSDLLTFTDMIGTTVYVGVVDQK